MLTEKSVKSPYLIVVVMIIVMILGVVSYQNTSVDLLPDMNLPYLVVATVSIGSAPEVVEEQVTKPVEEALGSLDNVKNMTSMSMENVSMIILEFTADADIDLAVIDVREKLNMIDMMDSVSDTVSSVMGGGDDGGALAMTANLKLEPIIVKLNPSMMPVMMSAISLADVPAEEAADYYREVIKKVEGVQGVASVSTSGLTEELILLQFDTTHLADSLIAQLNDEDLRTSLGLLLGGMDLSALGIDGLITPSLLNTLITAQNLDMPVGAVEEQGLSYFIKVGDTIKTKEELDNLPILGLDIGAVVQALNAGKVEDGTDYTFSQSVISSALELIPLISDSEKVVGEEESVKYSDIIANTLLNTVNDMVATAGGSVTLGDLTIGTKTDGDNILLTLSKAYFDDTIVGKLGNQELFLRLNALTTSYELNTSGKYITSLNGEPTVTLTIMKQPNASTVEVSKGIQEILDGYAEEDEGFSWISLFDQGYYIREVIRSMLTSMIEGGIFAIAVLFIFLRRVKPTLLVGISIAISTVATFVLMYFSGVTLNITSMGGLALGVGMLVDNSIVVIENIYRQRSLGKDNKTAAIDGAKQVGAAIFGSTLTTVIVFVPLLFVKGMIKDIFFDMAITICFSLIASLIFALTLVPMVTTTKLFKNETEIKQKWMTKLTAFYKKVLDKALDKKWITIVIVSVLFVGSVVSVLLQGMEFFPEMKSSGQLSFTLEFNMDKIPADKTYNDVSTDTVEEINQKLLALDYVETVGITESTGLIGSVIGDVGFDMGGDTTVFSGYIFLKEKRKIKDAKAVEEVAELLKSEDGLYEISVMAASESGDLINSYLGDAVSVDIFCDDLSDLGTATLKVANVIKGIDGIDSISTPFDSATMEYKLIVDKDKASKYMVMEGTAMLSILNALTTDESTSSIRFKGDSADTSLTIYPDDVIITTWQRARAVGSEHSIAVYYEKVYDYTVEGNSYYTYYVLNKSGSDIIINDEGSNLTVHNGGRIPVTYFGGEYYYELANGERVTYIPNVDNKFYYTIESADELNLITLPVSCITVADLSGGDMSGIMSGTGTVTVPLWKLLKDECFIKDDNGNTLMVYNEETAEYVPAGISKTQSQLSISRINGKRYMTITGTVKEGFTTGDATTAITKAMKDVELGTATYSFSGQSELITDTFETLYLILGLGIVLIYLVMVAQFQSLKSPFIVMFTIPLAFTGSIYALLMCGMNVSAPALVGLVVLVGIVVNNGIVFVDYANKLVDNGMPLKEALIKTGVDRLRPILMTALTTIFGMIAMALDSTEAGFIIQPMAITAMGGLLYATLLTLFFVPIMYMIFNKKRKAKAEIDEFMLADVKDYVAVNEEKAEEAPLADESAEEATAEASAEIDTETAAEADKE